MKAKTNKIIGYSLVVGILLSLVALPTMAYNCKPGDTECEQAKANMQQSQEEAADYTKKATSVEEIIEQLDTEIAELNGVIASNEAKVKKLNIEIKATEKKLSEEKSALAELLVNMHFSSDAEPILVIAGSTSISDLAEKAAREEVAKQEIAAASEKVKAAKEQFDKEKEEVEAVLRENESNRERLATKQSDQRELKAVYENKADDAEAVAAYWEKQVQAMAWTPPSNTTGSGSRWAGTGNTYPYRDNCPQDNVQYSAYGGAVCQCTSYASYKAYEKWGITNTWGGNAYSYENGAGRRVPNNGATTYVDSSPAANTIAIWKSGEYGHVAWVESVNADGSINISEYNVNWPSVGCYIGDYCSRSGVGSTGVRFLHFE